MTRNKELEPKKDKRDGKATKKAKKKQKQAKKDEKKKKEQGVKKLKMSLGEQEAGLDKQQEHLLETERQDDMEAVQKEENGSAFDEDQLGENKSAKSEDQSENEKADDEDQSENEKADDENEKAKKTDGDQEKSHKETESDQESDEDVDPNRELPDSIAEKFFKWLEQEGVESEKDETGPDENDTLRDTQLDLEDTNPNTSTQACF